MRSYKYWAKPLRDLPETFWGLAQKMQETWNSLVEAREKAEEAARALPKDQQKAFWTSCRVTCREIVAESGLNWECGPEILERFETACRMAARGERGWPKRQEEVRSVVIPHYYTNGGICASGLFRSSRRLALRPVPAEAYNNLKRENIRRRLTRGTFGFGGGAFEFETILHRPLPSTAFIKRCAWTGKNHPLRGWRWFLVVTVEEPPAPTHPSQKTAAVEFGWRVFGDAIRVAVVVDQDGCIQELRLPLDAARSHERRHSLPSGWRDLEVIDSQIAKLAVKAITEVHSVCPELHPLPTSPGGLARLQYQLHESRAWPEALEVLCKWKGQNDRLRSIRASLSERLIGRRRRIYRNFAGGLSRKYKTLILKRTAIQRLSQTGRGVDPAGKYRQWASPAELSLYVRQAAASNACVVKEAESAFSTTTCADCGAQAAQTGDVILTCSNGHRWDQDQNAARNLLSQGCPDSRQLNYLQTQWPERLRANN